MPLIGIGLLRVRRVGGAALDLLGPCPVRGLSIWSRETGSVVKETVQSETFDVGRGQKSTDEFQRSLLPGLPCLSMSMSSRVITWQKSARCQEREVIGRDGACDKDLDIFASWHVFELG
jgi:hypothetical protein